MIKTPKKYKVTIHYETEIEASTKKIAIRRMFEELEDSSNWGLGIVLQEDHTKAELIKNIIKQ